MFDREKLVLETAHIRKREFVEQPRHIVYAADQNYIKHIGTALLSVLQNNTNPIHFHLLVSGSEGYDFNIKSKLRNKRLPFKYRILFYPADYPLFYYRYVLPYEYPLLIKRYCSYCALFRY